MTLINAGNLHLDKRCTSPNSGYTATHRSAQIAKATSYVHKTLGVIVDFGREKAKGGDKNDRTKNRNDIEAWTHGSLKS